MESNIKIGTLNLCLGLKSKKTLVKNILNENEIDVLCMQELEVDKDFDCNLLSIPGYVLEVEENLNKKRVGCYIRENLKYTRRRDLESIDCHIVILDIKERQETFKRIIVLYRSFNPFNVTAKTLFNNQLMLVKNAFTKNTILLGILIWTTTGDSM